MYLKNFAFCNACEWIQMTLRLIPRDGNINFEVQLRLQ